MKLVVVCYILLLTGIVTYLLGAPMEVLYVGPGIAGVYGVILIVQDAITATKAALQMRGIYV